MCLPFDLQVSSGSTWANEQQRAKVNETFATQNMPQHNKRSGERGKARGMGIYNISAKSYEI